MSDLVAGLAIKYAPIDKFVPCKQNKKIWGKKTEENKQLTELIRESGDIDPLLVCKSGNKLEILSGESRYHSAMALNKSGPVKFTQLPYKQIEVTDLKDKLKHVVIRNLGHSCSNSKAIRAVTQFLLLTEPKPATSEIADPRIEETPEFVEPLSSVKQRVTEIITALKFIGANKDKWINEVTRLYLRAKGNQHANRVIEGAARIADESGVDGLAVSNDKADEQAGIKKVKPQTYLSAHQGADGVLVATPEHQTIIGTIVPNYESLLQELESLKVKSKLDSEYGDSQGKTINAIESALLGFCEEAHMTARKLGSDVMPVIPAFKVETLMAGLGLRAYVHPDQSAPQVAAAEEF